MFVIKILVVNIMFKVIRKKKKNAKTIIKLGIRRKPTRKELIAFM